MHVAKVLVPVLALCLALTEPVLGADAAPVRLRFGIQTPQQGVTFAQLRETWQLAESLGFDSAWLYDHFLPIFAGEDGPVLEGWTTLSALATQTTRLRIGLLVDGNTYRNPALVAKMAVTVDQVSNGRLVLGIGAGWFEREHGAYGFPFGTAKQRAQMLDESLQVITKLWTEDHPTFRGRWYSLERAPFAPKSVQQPHPPIVVGGKGEKWIVPLVARYGNGWNAVTGVSPDGIRRGREIIAAECQRAGRSPCPTDVSVLLPLIAITNIPLAGPLVRLGARVMVEKRVAESVLADSPAAIRDRLRAYQEAGVTEVILSLRAPFDADLLRRFAKDIMPEFQQNLAR